MSLIQLVIKFLLPGELALFETDATVFYTCDEDSKAWFPRQTHRRRVFGNCLELHSDHIAEFIHNTLNQFDKGVLYILRRSSFENYTYFSAIFIPDEDIIEGTSNVAETVCEFLSSNTTPNSISENTLIREAQESYRDLRPVIGPKKESADYKLFEEVLSPAQFESYGNSGYFDTTGTDGRTYRIICDGYVRNIMLMINDTPIVQYCVHAEGMVPHFDNLVAQKLLIESDTDRFLLLANQQLLVPPDI